MSEATECRRERSERKLAELSALAERDLVEIVGSRQLCVYVTGSYGRLEAWRGSDADLFLLYDGGEGGERDVLPRIDRLRILGRLIEVVAKAELQGFDKDGEFLGIHDLRTMRRELGSPKDDGVNAFTARMLLFLESRPVQNPEMYRKLLERVIEFYFVDLDDHPSDFRPLFLLNDILRFWRTLTLNYEEARYRRKVEAMETVEGRDEAIEIASATSARKNFKLKFSRMATCFSMITWLSTDHVVGVEDVYRLCRLTPFERLDDLAETLGAQRETVDELKSRYEEFLVFDQRPKADVIDDFRDPETRRKKTELATEFGNVFFDLIAAVAAEDRRRYLVI